VTPDHGEDHGDAAAPVTVELDLVVIGDEILDGFIAEDNGRWLSERSRELGTPLRRMLVVRDNLDDIRQALTTCLDDPVRPRVVLTSGGVGGTWDDVTYEAVATTLGATTRYDDELAEPVEYVLDYMESLGFEMDDDAIEGMRRIARVPAPSTVVRHRTFLACTISDVDGGVADGGVSIVTLPGPPGHFRALVDGVVVPELLEGRGLVTAVAEIEHGYPENVLAGALRRIRTRHPEVTIGSYPGDVMLIRLQGPVDAVEAGAEELRSFLADLDRHPASEDVKSTWKRQVASWSGEE
jgi:molybdenum cofactor synthesis domain-containing protein